MSGFQFRFSDREGDVETEEVYEFPDLLAAIEEAKRVLAEMALDGIPKAPGAAITVEVVNSARVVVAKVGLTLNVEFPST
ncbi:DUF6894 family protein [Rhizobium sp. PL01]|uniref:DUF6894 family protein n=1 Tax=Rhizobium sp. PL01 TaxID=3085631 RepID=UPI002980AFA4|nr:hypothetical protein [Rhizobium sp. PL01]MDW5312986.1 hypothetical protein [Rhizobium sp. PL01]